MREQRQEEIIPNELELGEKVESEDSSRRWNH
jgi:hypothetical protein